jgi:predicted secreted protein
MANNFKDKAISISKAFGFSGYQIKSLNFSPSPERLFPQPMPLMARSMSADMAAPAIAVPNEGGKTTVSVGMQALIELLP